MCGPYQPLAVEAADRRAAARFEVTWGRMSSGTRNRWIDASSPYGTTAGRKGTIAIGGESWCGNAAGIGSGAPPACRHWHAARPVNMAIDPPLHHAQSALAVMLSVMAVRSVSTPEPGERWSPCHPRSRPRGGGTCSPLHAYRLAVNLLAAKPGLGKATVPAPSVGDSQGSQLYLTNCAACHQASGEGVPLTFPPLKGDRVVNDADPTRHITVVLQGMHGLPIDGVAYSVTMPPFAALLGDDQIAAVINHERSSWGNHGTPVTPAQVKQVREAGAQP